jgi:hypothetical protein
MVTPVERPCPRILYDDPSTLYYLHDPDSEANAQVEDSVQQPKSSDAAIHVCG